MTNPNHPVKYFLQLIKFAIYGQLYCMVLIPNSELVKAFV